MIIFAIALSFYFILAVAVPVIAAEVLEVRAEKDPAAAWPYWTVLPLTGRSPSTFSTGACQISDSRYYPAPISGFKDFDLTWGPLTVPASGKVDFQFIQAAGLIGSFKVYVCQSPGESGVEVLDLTDTKSYCEWSSPLLIDLCDFGFSPGQTYDVRLVIAITGHALYAWKIIPVPVIPIGTDRTSWGEIKGGYR